jgi:TetR/AcrR family transcriptional regulator
MPQITNPRAGAAGPILAAASALFAERGFERVSMREIASAAGVSKANLYHHYGSKQALYVATLHSAADYFEGPIERGTQGFERFFAGLCRDLLADLLDNEQAVRLILREALGGGVLTDETLATDVVGASFLRLRSLFARARGSREVNRRIDPAAIAALVIAVNVFYFLARNVIRHLPGIAPLADEDRYSRAIARVLLDGILPEP